jgi:drug/metabolite transporter (DMT)-like permease
MNRPSAAPPPALLWSLAVLINVVWALVYPLSKELLTAFPPMGLACWRLAGAALLILPFIRLPDVVARMTAKDFRLLLLMGLVGCGLSIVLQFLATPLTLASNISLIASFETLFVIALGHVSSSPSATSCSVNRSRLGNGRAPSSRSPALGF